MNPELKNIIEDIVNKYLSFIDTGSLKDFVFNIVESNYKEGLESGELQFNQNYIPDYRTVSFLQKFAFDNVKSMSEEMKEKLRKEVSMGLMNRETVSQLKVRIRDVMNTTIERAELITRTETNRAFNMGHYQSAKESGLDVIKEWNAQPEKDELNPCPICDALDGKQVPMNGKFRAVNGEEYLLPPVHPRCKCRVIYIQK